MAAFLIFGLCAAVWLALVSLFRWRRIWLPYYATGSVGLALLIVFAGTRLIPMEYWMEYATAFSAHAISQSAGIPTRVFEAAPGNILVWVVVQSPGWTVVRVDLECSGLLELATLAGLILFYPAWTFKQRVGLVLVGWLATFVANIIRVLVIILILHVMGKQSIFVAHTIIGRLIFFALVAGVYWVILTRGTLKALQKRLAERMLS